MKESLRVLQECAELQTKKSQDYQSSESTVVQAMHLDVALILFMILFLVK